MGQFWTTGGLSASPSAAAQGAPCPRSGGRASGMDMAEPLCDRKGKGTKYPLCPGHYFEKSGYIDRISSCVLIQAGTAPELYTLQFKSI